MDKKKLYYWNVLTYNGKCLVLIELDEILACGNRRISSLSSIIALIDGSSSEEVENQLKKRSAEQNFLYEQSTNKKRRLV
uniref:Uncharacterized protein n=1 Tax=Brassica oleracea TaxID=3712 RepID=A0A3P6GAW1_BRAOL|nr:unnamed protein product [Brassica oleracea]